MFQRSSLQTTTTQNYPLQTGLLQRKCAQCDEKDKLLQRQAVNQSEVSDVPASVHEVLQLSGQPLDADTRTFMESRFGHDFSQVRIHTDATAMESAKAVHSLAYTVGHNIVFNQGQYAPTSMAGQKLLAHELTHVVQQGNSRSNHSLQSKLSVTALDDAYEREADRVAGAVVNASPGTEIPAINHISSSPLAVQRLGANPGCTPAERTAIHQAIFNARGWLNKAIAKLEARPVSAQVSNSLRRNFGPTYGVTANIPLIVGRLRTGYHELSTIPIGCAGAVDATCATGACGYAFAGSHQATICSNNTLTPGADAIYRAGCLLHESLHAAFSNFTVDEYSGWHGHSGSTATYPGTGTDPLLNADSYTTLTMDLS